MKRIKISFGPLQWVFSVLLALMIFAGACKRNSNETEKLTTVGNLENYSNELPQDFIEFYQKFHEDSIYQLEHIDFPLKGLPDGADPEEKDFEDYYYTRDQWVLHKTFDPKLFSTEMIVLSDIIIEERITERKYQLMIIRRFAKGSGGWRLIYYAGLNKFSER